MKKTEKTHAIQVPFHLVQDVRNYLIQHNILRKDLKLKKNTNHVYLPITTTSPTLPFQDMQYGTTQFEYYQKTPSSYKDVLSHLPKHLKQHLPTSYDVIGDIILLKLPKQLHTYSQEIGSALLNTHNHINVVCSVEPVTGELRTRNLQIIAGEQRTATTHTEYGLRFNVDIQKTYFSPRLATERKRIATLVQPHETVVDLFAGVAPFSILIARYAKPKIIYAVDKNKDAITYAYQNITQNQVLDKIQLIHADAQQIPTLFKQQHRTADRIIMNLPFSAHAFFSHALRIAANPCIIHYYDILKKDEVPKQIESLEQYAKKQNKTLHHINIRTIKTYAPREFYIGIDITARTQTPM